MKHLHVFENFSNDKIILRDGDLANRLEEFGFKDQLASDIFSYMADENVEAMKQLFRDRWSNVETINLKNFPIFRGFAISQENPDYEFWDNLIGDRATTFDGPVYLAKDKVTYSVDDYSSWSAFYANAVGYAGSRPGDIKIVLTTDVHSVKVFANLFEIGDESEELIAYPIPNQEFRYTAWRKNK